MSRRVGRLRTWTHARTRWSSLDRGTGPEVWLATRLRSPVREMVCYSTQQEGLAAPRYRFGGPRRRKNSKRSCFSGSVFCVRSSKRTKCFPFTETPTTISPPARKLVVFGDPQPPVVRLRDGEQDRGEASGQQCCAQPVDLRPLDAGDAGTDAEHGTHEGEARSELLWREGVAHDPEGQREDSPRDALQNAPAMSGATCFKSAQITARCVAPRRSPPGSCRARASRCSCCCWGRRIALALARVPWRASSELSSQQCLRVAGDD